MNQPRIHTNVCAVFVLGMPVPFFKIYLIITQISLFFIEINYKLINVLNLVNRYVERGVGGKEMFYLTTHSTHFI